jgi:tetratricopeptide (TPR) repeat protein
VPARWLFRIPSWRVLIVLLLAGLVLGLGGPNAWAWYQLRAASSDLARFHPDEAREHLTNCLKVWPNSASTHLLASRAARQSGDLDEADRQLRACQRLLGGTSGEVALEWALLQAARGNGTEVEEFLQRRADQNPELSPIIWEALVEGYIRLYRTLDAMACLDHWLRIDPKNLRALELRGQAYQAGKSAPKASEDFRRVLEQDPTREATRWRLVLCLLEMGSYEEAFPHLERIAREKPGDPNVLVRLARCHNMLGRGEQARQILDAVLKEDPEHGLALRTNGQFALTDRQPEQAEHWLRQAAKVMPHDYQTQWLLFQSLQQQNKVPQAQAQLRIAEEVKEQTERLGELRSRKMAEQPLDPVLHYEMGVLLLRTGQQSAGEGWLLNALALDPAYRPAHAALAEYYERQGETAKAAEHRRKLAAKE